MFSRYDNMNASSVKDIDDEFFPDPLSVTYNDIQLTQVPTFKKVTSADLDKPWTYMVNNYGISELDDVLLNINGVPYIGMLKPGDTILNINENDLLHFNSQKLPGMEDI